MVGKYQEVPGSIVGLCFRGWTVIYVSLLSEFLKTFGYRILKCWCLGFMQLSVKLTKEIVNTYRVCNPRFQFSESHNPKRFLTIPSAGVSNNGSDNENHDLILYFGRVLVNEDRTHRWTFFRRVIFLECKMAWLGSDCIFLLSSSVASSHYSRKKWKKPVKYILKHTLMNSGF